VKVIDAVSRVLKIDGAELLSAYPTTPLIEATAKAEIRAVLCRQERVGWASRRACAGDERQEARRQQTGSAARSGSI
jgi:hypothetical protein